MSLTEAVALLLFFIGIYGIIVRKNMIKTIMSICIAETAIILFFLSINFEFGAEPPIGVEVGVVADPFVQALMITAIVIGIAVTAFAISLFIGLYHRYGTTHWDKAKEERRNEEASL